MHNVRNSVLNRKRHSSGHAVVEFSLAIPWLFFLFVGVFDAGIYAYSLVSVESAARTATLYTSSSSSTQTDSGGACRYALAVLQSAANVGTGVTTCNALPVQVTATAVSGPDSTTASSVSVTYQTPQIIPIPGILMSRYTVTRTVQMRVKS
jgi:Flp pilus assembly protein TadG